MGSQADEAVAATCKQLGITLVEQSVSGYPSISGLANRFIDSAFPSLNANSDFRKVYVARRRKRVL